ncbi:uncharacterized protein LOC131656161 isoform X2 [Vicia villosa]|uniref:uncharacterized protein LOC131656161 isoform X2 n=1 Tax=Vicia villosa TaxID=3911 RepID=UPI00273AC34A|nr:uncharacterized protein LOC131656161 isoform X2 [Vicia villosa]
MIPVDNGITSPRNEIEESNGSQVKEFASLDISTPNEKDLISQPVASPNSNNGLKSRLRTMFSKKVDWNSVKKMCMEWIKNPVNMALFAWVVCVAVSGAILFLVMTGMLNNVLKTKSERNTWFEINNQILNALFTLMCLYQHPKRFHQLVLLCRWRTNDISRLRMIYCKNGTGYTRSQRPAVGVGITISVAIVTPAIAGLYIILSPLGKDYDCERDEESQEKVTKPFEKKYAFVSKDQQGEVIELENRPNWRGGIFEIWHDISVSFLSLFCSFCEFGWNMERLGFGNMYVHIATFMLLCMAPFWVFVLASGNIDDDNVRIALIAVGIILCFCGLLYGGFWRIQMRKRFNLPAYDFCFGKPSASDCALWLCCCWCSLAQEVRTGNSYDILEDKLCLKSIDTCDQVSISNLDREDVVVSTKSGSSITLEGGKDGTMTPPTPSLIQKEDC